MATFRVTNVTDDTRKCILHWVLKLLLMESWDLFGFFILGQRVRVKVEGGGELVTGGNFLVDEGVKVEENTLQVQD